MQNFWQKLKQKNKNRPLVVLAPMADVTDPAFRAVIAKYGAPDAMWTEFVSADALIMAPKNNPDETGLSSHDKILADLRFGKNERPIVAQIFSANPARMETACEIIANMGFDGIDLNMGCPDKNIVKSGSGSAHIKNPKLAVEIILSAKRGIAKSKNPQTALSVKTRVGFNKDETDTWLPKILETHPAVLTVHARTKKEMSKSPADWSRIKRAVKLRDELQKNLSPHDRTLIFGNGDVKNVEEAMARAKETACDGVMIGRGIFGRPWLFQNLAKGKNHNDPNLKTRLKILTEHIKLFNKLMPYKNFNIMKKHFKAYVEGFAGAKELRARLMETNNFREADTVIKKWVREEV